MIQVRKSNERGIGRHGWLTTRHTFSFANYFDPRFMGFRDLRVINEDTVAPARGFGSHRHENMEIISIVTKGALAHRDSIGSEGVLRAGEVQHMSAGSGVVHSEFNASESEPVEFFQIWIEPAEEGIEPRYTQKQFDEAERRDRLRVLVSPDGRDGSLRMHQDAHLYSTILSPLGRVSHSLESGRGAWIHIVQGSVNINGTLLQKGDGAAIENESNLEVTAGEDGAEWFLFDLK